MIGVPTYEVGTTYSTRIKEVMAWHASKNDFNITWDGEEVGSWTVDGHVFNNRRKFIIDSESEDSNVRAKILSEHTSNAEAVRYVQTIRTGKTLRKIDANYSDCVLKFRPLSNSVAYSITPNRDIWKYAPSESNLPIITNNTGSLSVQASTGSHDRSLLINYIYASKYVEKQLIHLRKKDVKIVFENVNSEWYLFDTTETSNGDITLSNDITTNAAYNRDPIFYEKWKRFPNQTNTTTGMFGDTILINYRK